MMNQSQVMNPVHVPMHQMAVNMNQLPQVYILNQIHPMNHISDQSQFTLQVPHIVNRSNEIWLPPRSNAVNRAGFSGGHSYVHRKRMDRRRREKSGMKSVRLGHGSGYRPPTLYNDFNRFHQNENFNNKRSAPYAPRNTTSFLIRAKRCGGIADLVSPIPVTPSILSTPQLSPLREILGDMVKEKWGVDGYGSMNGLIRLKSPEHFVYEEVEDGSSSSSSGSDVEEHIEMEKRLDHDLRRFEMIYPQNYGRDHNGVLENRVNDQDDHICELEKENTVLREKLHLMENEMNDFRKMLQNLETHNSSENDDTIEGNTHGIM